MYDPSIGRWLTPDPIGFDGGDPNLYRFVGNKPTIAIDPSGLKIIVISDVLPGATPPYPVRFAYVPDGLGGDPLDYVKKAYPEYKNFNSSDTVTSALKDNPALRLFIGGAAGDSELEKEIVTFLNIAQGTPVPVAWDVLGSELGDPEKFGDPCVRWTRAVDVAWVPKQKEMFKTSKLRVFRMEFDWPSATSERHSILIASYDLKGVPQFLGADIGSINKVMGKGSVPANRFFDPASAAGHPGVNKDFAESLTGWLKTMRKLP